MNLETSRGVGAMRISFGVAQSVEDILWSLEGWTDHTVKRNADNFVELISFEHERCSVLLLPLRQNVATDNASGSNACVNVFGS